VHIGDDPRSDVGGAKDFGMYAIQTLYTGATVSDSADGHVTDLAQVSDVLDRL
jgi:FMN phosphatase YigB (HAD superfamily)